MTQKEADLVARINAHLAFNDKLRGPLKRLLLDIKTHLLEKQS